MPGTIDGGYAARDTNIAKYGKSFYKTIGAEGGRRGHSGGFAAGEAGRLRAQLYGRIGGKISRRNGKLPQKQREKLTAAFQLKRQDYLDEIAKDNMARLSKLDQKYGVKRPW